MDLQTSGFRQTWSKVLLKTEGGLDAMSRAKSEKIWNITQSIRTIHYLEMKIKIFYFGDIV